MPRREHRITNCNAKELSVNIKKSNCDCISFNERGFKDSNNIYLGYNLKSKLLKKTEETTIFHSFALQKSVLNKYNRKKLAKIVRQFAGEVKKVHNKSFGDLSNIIGKNNEYVARLKRQILNGSLTAGKYFRNLTSWYDVLSDGLSQEKREEFLNLYNSHFKDIIYYYKLELLIYYTYYKDLVNKSGWKFITTFNDFCQIILQNKVTRVGNFPFEICCGVKDHKDRKIVIGKNLGQCNYYCQHCSPHGQSIKYDELLFLALSNRYELQKPSSEKDWTEMILINKIEKRSPAFISITLVCDEHGDFSSTCNRLQQDHHCPNCKLLSVDEIEKRGGQFGLELITPTNQIRSKLKNVKPLEWRCVIHKETVMSLPYISELTHHYCQKCSKGKITYERIIRHMLNKMFFDKFGEKPMSCWRVGGLKFNEIIKNHKIEKFFSKNYVTESDYNKSHFDCFGFIKIDNKILSVDVEVWGPQHKDLSTFLKIYPNNNSFDYKRLKIYDNLRKILREEGFLDIHIVLPLYNIGRNKFQDYIIKEFKQQLLEYHGIRFNRKFPRSSWTNLMRDIRFAKDYQNLKGYL